MYLRTLIAVTVLFALVLCAQQGANAVVTYRQAFPIGSCSDAYEIVWGYYSDVCTSYPTCVAPPGQLFAVKAECNNITGPLTYWPTDLATRYPGSKWLQIALNSDVNCNTPTGEVWMVEMDTCKQFDATSSLKVFSSTSNNEFTIHNYTGSTCEGIPQYNRTLTISNNTAGACYYETNFTSIPLNLNNGGVRYSMYDVAGVPLTVNGAISNSVTATLALIVALCVTGLQFII